MLAGRSSPKISASFDVEPPEEGVPPSSPGLRWGFSLKVIFFLLLGTLWSAWLSVQKQVELDRFAHQSLRAISEDHPELRLLYQKSFHFYLDAEFLPGIRKVLEKVPSLNRIRLLSETGQVFFDSDPAQKGVSETFPKETSKGVRFAYRNFEVDILIPAGEISFVYTFKAKTLQKRLYRDFLLGILALTFGTAIFWKLAPSLFRFTRRWPRVWGLRFFGIQTKFLFAIFVLQGLTAFVLYLSLTRIQAEFYQRQAQKDALAFSRFSTPKIGADYANWFTFYFEEKFHPSVRSLIAANEHLRSIRILSVKDQKVLFDSDRSQESPVLGEKQGEASLTPDVQVNLQSQHFAQFWERRAGESVFSVIFPYENDRNDPVVWVHYVFGFEALSNQLEVMRRQVFIDLIPSLLVGLLIAAIFAQILLSPIRKLARAFKLVADGDYQVHIPIRRLDEMGSLISAFNRMTRELRKKKELKKYLSDSTYRRIMAASEEEMESRLRGARVQATVLMADIRDFVRHCERMEAEDVTSLLNDYFSRMVEVVYRNQGEVDKFMGDALLAVFYEEASDQVSPSSRTSTALQAVYCALEMKEELKKFNEQQKLLHRPTLEIGVGISSGELISGPIGSNDRKDFTVIGDVVNVSSRIEKLSKQGRYTKIVFADNVESSVQGLLEYELLCRETIRGKETELSVFELVRVRDLEELKTALIAPLSDDSEKSLLSQLRAIEVLGFSKNPEAVDVLLPFLRDDRTDIRVQTIVALEKLGVESGTDRIVGDFFERLQKETQERVLSTLIAALGRLCRSSKILDLKSFLDYPNERIVANTIEALGMTQYPKALEWIIPKLESRHHRVKANAAMVLFQAGRWEVINILKPMLMAGDALLRSSAAFALGEVAQVGLGEVDLGVWKREENKDKPSGETLNLFLAELQECVPMLVLLLKDHDERVKKQAIVALGKMRDKTAILPLIEVLKFEKESSPLAKDILNALRKIGSHRMVRDLLEKWI